MIIESPQNKIYKSAFLLKDKRHRDENGLFLVEGSKQIEEISEHYVIKNFFITQSFSRKQKYTKDKRTLILSDTLFKKLSSTQTPQGIIASVKKNTYNPEEIIENMSGGFFIILEKIQDPGNLGTVIRCADAFGAKAVFVSKESADIYSDKTIRASMGSLFHIPVINEIEIMHILTLMKKNNITTFAASLEASVDIRSSSFTKKSAIIIGNEAKGLSDTTQKCADKTIKINMPGKAESLNAAIAAAIIMYELSKNG